MLEEDEILDQMAQDEKKTSGGNQNKGSGVSSKGLFNPPIGKTKLRFIPGREKKNDGSDIIMPYMTHTYHEFPEKGAKDDHQGKRIYVPLRFEDGQKDPIQEYVNAGFSFLDKNPGYARKDEFSKYLKKIKRRRNQVAHAIHIPDMTDAKSKEIGLRHVFYVEGMKGTITRKMCLYSKLQYMIIRLPDYTFPDDKFIIPGNDVDRINIFSPDTGHDFNIVKTKGEGKFDVSLDDSYITSRPRPLTEEERDIYFNHGKSLSDPFVYANYEDALENLYASLSQWGFSQNFVTEVEKYAEDNREASSHRPSSDVQVFDNADAVLAELDDHED